ncbi:alpha/beta fold hydrolase [Streptosporangium sp. NPDC002607]
MTEAGGDTGVRPGWAANGDVGLHYIAGGSDDSAGGAVLVIPGFGERAEEYAWLLDALSPRRAVAVDLRGRGRSDAPPTGYGWEEHLADLEAIVDAAGLDEFTIVGISRGAGYGLGYALRHPGRVRGFLVGDYWARHAALPETWPDQALTSSLRGTPLAERVPAHVVRGLQRDAVEISLWEQLIELRGPVVVVRGTRRGVLVDDATVERYRRSLPHVEIHTLDGSGHDLWSHDPAPLLRLVRSTLDRSDAL